MNKFQGKQLVVASHNPGKVRELTDLLQPYGIEVIPAQSMGLAEPDETGESFAANARIKAVAAAKASGIPALADDSGLRVHALGGDPGIHSARWAGPEKDFGQAMKRIEDALGDNPDRRASFICALALAWPAPGPDGHGDGIACEIFEGRIDGDLTWPPRGEAGFGYDPMFVAAGHDRTFGEMEPPEKHAISHRARAFAKLVAAGFEGASNEAPRRRA